MATAKARKVYELLQHKLKHLPEGSQERIEALLNLTAMKQVRRQHAHSTFLCNV